MRVRFCLSVLLFAGILLPLTSCSNQKLTSIVINPTTVTVTLSSSGSQLITQYTAIGYYGPAGHQSTKNITDEVTWSSYFPQMLTTSNTGVVTPTGNVTGYTQVTASAEGYNGYILSNASTFTVNAAGTTTDVVSIAVTPANPVVTTLGTVEDFSAAGTTGTGAKAALTSGVTWSSSNTGVATIGPSTGAATTVAPGTTYIIASYTNADGLVATGYTILTVQ
jgi:hypothetical protein